MDIPKPKAPAPKPQEVKKPFVRPEHLTDKPLRNHEGLQALRQSMPDAKRDRRTR